MHRRRQEYVRWTVMAATLVVGAVLSVVAATAYACTVAATVTLDEEAGVAGSTVTGSGENFDSAVVAKPVEIRFDSLDGPVIWSGVPNAAGIISFSFTAPDVEPGAYTVVVTQRNATNENFRNGTPARATYTVQPAAAPVATLPLPAAVPKPAAPAANKDTTAAPRNSRAQSPRSSPERSNARPSPVQPAQAEPVPRGASSQPLAATEARPARSSNRSAARNEPSRSGQGSSSSPVNNDAATRVPAESSRRSTMVSAGADGSSSNFPTLLAMTMLGIGFVLSLGAGGLVLASRRSEKQAPAEAGR